MLNVVTAGKLSNTRLISFTSKNGFEIYRAEGIKDTLDALSSIMDRTTGPLVKQVYIEGARTLATQIENNAPPPDPIVDERGWQHIRESVFVAAGPVERPYVLVGISHAKAPHALWIEYGTSTRYTRKGAFRGQLQPKPFFRPAVSVAQAAVLDIIAQGIKDLVERLKS